MSHKELRKYINQEMQRDFEERKTIAEKYRRYNNFMVLMSFIISIAVILAFVMLFDYQVIRPQDNRTNAYFTEKTALVSYEMANVLTCETRVLNDPDYFKLMSLRLEEQKMLMIVNSPSEGLIFASESLNEKKITENIKLSIDGYRDKYIVERHIMPHKDWYIYFLIPKSDEEIMKKSFLIFIALIFLISTLFRSVFSRNIMRRVYNNMVEPLEKLKQGTHKIRMGNYDEPICPEDYYNRELKDTFRDFEHMRLQLKENKVLSAQYEANRKELISNISNDLKTPIASIIGYVEGLLDGVANTAAKKERYMQIIYKKSLDMNRLINDLILFSKLDVNKLAFDFTKINFQNYVEDLFEEYGIEMQESGIQFISRYECTENIFISIDTKQLRRVFNNIIGNALKHLNKETKAIEIVVLEENDEIVVRISDNGSGIPANKVDQIFDRFYKGDVSRNTEIGSSGLGLSISKQIVQAHGGKIWASSEIDQGTIIYFTLSKKEKING